MGRTDTASRTVAAAPDQVYAALLDPDALSSWLPPQGMRARFERFDGRPGDDVPPGITADDHAAGMASSLANLAAHLERHV